MLSVYTAVPGCISSNDTVLISACSGCGMHSAGFRLVPSVVVLVSGSHSADVTCCKTANQVNDHARSVRFAGICANLYADGMCYKILCIEKNSV